MYIIRRFVCVCRWRACILLCRIEPCQPAGRWKCTRQWCERALGGGGGVSASKALPLADRRKEKEERRLLEEFERKEYPRSDQVGRAGNRRRKA